MTPRRPRSRAPAVLAVLLALGLTAAGCGGDDSGGGAAPPEVRDKVAQAERVTAAEFPPVRGRTLQQIADTVEPGPEIGLATSEYTVGPNRLAFGLIDAQQQFIYGKTAVYVAPTPNDVAQGPFPAPADSLLVDGPYRSRNAAEEDSAIAAIYAAEVPLRRPGQYAVLSVTKVGNRLVGAPTGIEVKQSGEIPEPGDRAPAIDTPTVASVAGNVRSIDTREPPSDMHAVSFKDVVGKKPVSLLFATPQLCQSRVCGPVTDLAVQLKREYGDRIEFIHQEVYVDNEIPKGFREQLKAFKLDSEPWLFTFDREGRVAARLQGSFGKNEFRAALDQALEGAPAPTGEGG